jgi:hypothetical protein
MRVGYTWSFPFTHVVSFLSYNVSHMTCLTSYTHSQSKFWTTNGYSMQIPGVVLTPSPLPNQPMTG